MSLTWLHLSDFHIRVGDSYDRDVVLRALVRSVREFRESGRGPDVVFATGDIGFSGKSGEYEVATAFFDDLLDAAGLERRNLFVIPGNHDVDRALGVGLARTLASERESEAYFAPSAPRPHLTQKQGAFLDWYRTFFTGIRDCPVSSCGPVELVEAGGLRVGVLPINSACFCHDDDDHAKLWVGRRSLDEAVSDLRSLNADFRIALVHHPLDWLADLERSNVRGKLAESVDIVLRGHLHETDVEQVASPQGGVVHLVAGAAYQTRGWPNRALFVTVDDSSLSVFPIRYEDSPTEVWTVDPSVFPHEQNYTGTVEIPQPKPRTDDRDVDEDSLITPSMPPSVRFRSNVPSRRGLPFVGRDSELSTMAERLDDPAGERVLVVSGPPGVGKSELAREFARRHRDRYQGGTFFIDATSASATALIDLSRVAVNFLGMEFRRSLSLEDQCEQALIALSAAPVLLLYDNVQSFDAIERWLPAAGMPCHVVITSLADPRNPGWSVLPVEPLRPKGSLELVEALAGSQVAELYGPKLTAYSGGLPVQLCPTAAVLAYEERRGRGAPPDLASMAIETRASFSLVYEHLDESERLLLHAAAGLNPQRIDRAALHSDLETAVDWSETQFSEAVDTCADLHLLQGDAQMTMHQLFSSFLRLRPPDIELVDRLAQIRKTQGGKLIATATELLAKPADGALAALMMGFALAPDLWDLDYEQLTAGACTVIGGALIEIGQFEQARPWYEQAASLHQEGNGRVDHENLSTSLHQIGLCYTSTGKFEQARPWYEKAVEEARQGDIQSRVNHDSLGKSINQIGDCYSGVGEFEQARPWYEKAVEEKRQGDIHGRVDHESLSVSLHQIGVCHSSMDQFEQARPWYEKAVEEARQGDIHSRVDHDSLSTSLHQIGLCYTSTGKFEQARPWYEKAVEEARQGDIHGRVSHDSLGRTLHQIGFCYSSTGKLKQARPWYEKAVEEKRQGDIHGRVDHDSFSKSLYQIGRCHASVSDFEQARPWYEQAINEARQGDIHGHIDHLYFYAALRAGAQCLRELDETDQATLWETEARSSIPPSS